MSNLFSIFIIFRCSWSYWCPHHWAVTRKITVCTRRILQNPISKSPNTIWKTFTKITFFENSFISSDWAAIFCSTSWQNTNWDPDQRHVIIRVHLSVAHNGWPYGLSCFNGSSLFHVKSHIYFQISKHSFHSFRCCSISQRY